MRRWRCRPWTRQGLTGLADRVAVVDGRMLLSSPDGGPDLRRIRHCVRAQPLLALGAAEQVRVVGGGLPERLALGIGPDQRAGVLVVPVGAEVGDGALVRVRAVSVPTEHIGGAAVPAAAP